MKRTNNSKKSNIQELDYNSLAGKLNESSPEVIKNILSEQVRQAYASILNESDEDDDEDVEDYEVEEVDDTNTDNAEELTDTDVDDADMDAEDGGESEDADVDVEDDSEGMDSDAEDGVGVETTVVAVDDEPADDEEEGIGHDFDKFKVGDDEYDFRDAEDEEIVKVYKRLKNDDNVTVVTKNGKVEISDNETGAEYIIDMNSSDDAATSGEEEIIDNINSNDMTNESVIFEIALNEYDSHVGYTDNYQNKDVMTGDNVNEPSKNGRDIDKGVPHGSQKPWSKQKKSVAPFNGEKGKTVECGTGVDVENPDMSETLAQKGATKRMHVKSHVPNTSGQDNPKGHEVSVAGELKTEAIIKKANKIFAENKKLKAELEKFTSILKEAAVTNVNLGGIIKLISENSTSKDEKREIINRFTNEAHTIEESKNLYQRILNELQKKTQMNINEEKVFNNGSPEVINESKFYQDENLMDSLGLMHKICK